MIEKKFLVTMKFTQEDFNTLATAQGLSPEQLTDEVLAGWLLEDMQEDSFDVDSVVPA